MLKNRKSAASSAASRPRNGGQRTTGRAATEPRADTDFPTIFVSPHAEHAGWIREFFNSDQKPNLAEYMMFLNEMARAEEASPAAMYIKQWLPELLAAQTATRRMRKARLRLDSQYSVARPAASPVDTWLAAGEEVLAKEIADVRRTSQQEFHLTTPAKAGKRAANRLSDMKLLVLRLGVGATFSEIAAASPARAKVDRGSVGARRPRADKKKGELDSEVLRQRVRRLKRQLILSGKWVAGSP